MSAKTLTVEIGNEFIKICEMQNSKKTVMVHHAISIQTPTESVEDGFVKDITKVSDVIKGALKEEEIVATEVTFILNSSRVATKEVILPLVKKEKVQEMVNINASEYFPVNIDDYVLSFTVLENNNSKEEKKSRVLVYAAPEAMVQSYYDLAKVLGMKVKAVDYAGNSTLQLIKIQIDAKPTLVVQMGMDTTIVSVMSNNILQLQRTIPYGESLILNAVIESKKVSSKVAMELMSSAKLIKNNLDEDELTGSLKYLISNVNRVIEYYSSRNTGNPIQKVVIIGDGADVLGIDELFSNETSLPAERVTLLKNVESYNRIKVSTSLLKQYMANVGASLDPIHLQPKSMLVSTKSNAQNDGIYKVACIGMILAALALGIYAFIGYNNEVNNKDDLKKDISKIENINNLEKKYLEGKNKYSDIEKFYYSTVNSSEWTPEFISALEKNMTPDMKVASMDILNGIATMEMTCKSKPEVAALAARLKKVENIISVSVSEIKEEENGIVSFSMKVGFMTEDSMKVAASILESSLAEEAAKQPTTTAKGGK